MPATERDVIELLCTLAEEERLRVTVRESLKGGLIAGVSTVGGGVLLGPFGLALGGIVGGCLAATLAHGKFLPAVEVIATMPQAKRDILTNKIKSIMQNVQVADVAMFAAMITGDLSVRRRVLETLIDHLRTEMSMTLVDHV